MRNVLPIVQCWSSHKLTPFFPHCRQWPRSTRPADTHSHTRRMSLSSTASKPNTSSVLSAVSAQESFYPAAPKKKAKQNIHLYLLPNFSLATCFRLGSSLLPHGEIQDGSACFCELLAVELCPHLFPLAMYAKYVCRGGSRGDGSGGWRGRIHRNPFTRRGDFFFFLRTHSVTW